MRPMISSTMQVERQSIPRGDAGVRATVAQMIRLIRLGSSSPTVRKAATSLVKYVQARDYLAQSSVIRAWVASHLKFLRDPRGTELLHTPDVLLSMISTGGTAYADCDDAAILAGALALAIGLRVRIVTVAFKDPSAPFTHTFAEVGSPIGDPKWLEQDVTRSAQSIDPSLISRRYIVEV